MRWGKGGRNFFRGAAKAVTGGIVAAVKSQPGPILVGGLNKEAEKTLARATGQEQKVKRKIAAAKREEIRKAQEAILRAWQADKNNYQHVVDMEREKIEKLIRESEPEHADVSDLRNFLEEIFVLATLAKAECQSGDRDYLEKLLALDVENEALKWFMNDRPLRIAFDHLKNHQKLDALQLLITYYEKNFEKLDEINQQDYLRLKTNTAAQIKLDKLTNHAAETLIKQIEKIISDTVVINPANANQELIEAAKRHDIYRAKKALQAGADINAYGYGAPGGEGQGPLCAPALNLAHVSHANMHSLIEFADFLMHEKNINVDAYNNGIWLGSEHPPVIQAAWWGTYPMSLLLLARGANMWQATRGYDPGSYHPLKEADDRANQNPGCKIIAEIYRSTETLPKQAEWVKAYDFYRAVMDKEQAKVNELKQSKVDANILLWLVSLLGHWEVFHELGNTPSDVNLKIGNYLTPLLLAIEMGHADIVSKLLSLKADLEQLNVEGFSAFNLACKLGDENIVQLFLDNNISVEKIETGLEVAESHAQIELCTKLEEHLEKIKNSSRFDAANLTATTPQQQFAYVFNQPRPILRPATQKKPVDNSSSTSNQKSFQPEQKISAEKYSEDKIKQLLNHYLGKIPTVEIFDAYNNISEITLRNMLRQARDGNKEFCVIPIDLLGHETQIKGGHDSWAILVLKFGKDRTCPNIFYRTSLGSGVPYEIKTLVSSVFAGEPIIDSTISVRGSNAGGAWAVEFARHLVTANAIPTDISAAITEHQQALASAKPGDSPSESKRNRSIFFKATSTSESANAGYLTKLVERNDKTFVSLVFSNVILAKKFQTTLFNQGFENISMSGEPRKINVLDDGRFEITLTGVEYDAIYGDGEFAHLQASSKLSI